MPKKGYVFSQEHRHNISVAHLGKPKLSSRGPRPAMAKWYQIHGHPKWTLGKKTSDETKKKISEALKKRLPRKWTRKERQEASERMKIQAKALGYGKWMKGKKLSLETRKKMSESSRGDKASRWEGGLTKKSQLFRHSLAYREWRDKVFKRDKYICTIGGKAHGNKLNVHHIKPFASHPELRLDINNGITLCENCHKKTDTYLRNNKKKH